MEMKFRVWDKERRRFWLTDDGIYFYLDPAMDRRLAVGICGFMKKDRFEVLQFTGAKDKTGKEIYRGDIVNVNGKNREIVWRGSGFFCTWSDYGLDTCWFAGGAPVVVGNRFENPELVNGKQT